MCARSGYGMVCREPVPQGQALVCVPRRLLMTAETAKQDEQYGALVRDTGLTEWQVGRVSERHTQAS